MTRHIGIYPGTFDPVHAGHIAFAQEAMRACGLNEIVFLPEQSPRSKHNVTDITQRIALLQKITQPLAGLRVDRLASKRFTVMGTMPEIHNLFGKSELTLLVGSDVARTFEYRWEGLESLLNQVSLAIGLRGSDTTEEISALIAKLEHEYNQQIRHTIIRTEQAHISSSQLRNACLQVGAAEA